MPDDLWAAAAAAAATHGIGRIAGLLGLNYAALKDRFQGRQPQKPAPAEVHSGFMQLEAGRLFAEWPQATPTVAGPTPPLANNLPESPLTLAFAAADGATMTVTIPAGHAVDLVALADAFWRRGA